MSRVVLTTDDEIYIDLDYSSPNHVPYELRPVGSRSHVPRQKHRNDYACPKRLKRERATNLYRQVGPDGQTVLVPNYYPSAGFSYPKNHLGMVDNKPQYQVLEEVEEETRFPFYVTKTKTYFVEPGHANVHEARLEDGSRTPYFYATGTHESSWLDTHLKLEIKL